MSRSPAVLRLRALRTRTLCVPLIAKACAARLDLELRTRTAANHPAPISARSGSRASARSDAERLAATWGTAEQLVPSSRRQTVTVSRRTGTRSWNCCGPIPLALMPIELRSRCSMSRGPPTSSRCSVPDSRRLAANGSSSIGPCSRSRLNNVWTGRSSGGLIATTTLDHAAREQCPRVDLAHHRAHHSSRAIELVELRTDTRLRRSRRALTSREVTPLSSTSCGRASLDPRKRPGAPCASVRFSTSWNMDSRRTPGNTTVPLASEAHTNLGPPFH